jgi:hypothetical protein
MKIFSYILIIIYISIKTSFAVTIKSGEVLGADGKVYKGASPEQKDKIISSLSKKDKPVEIINNNLMILHEDKLISIPLSELNGKSDKKIDEIIDGEFGKVGETVSKQTKSNTNKTLNTDVKATSKNQTKAISSIFLSDLPLSSLKGIEINLSSCNIIKLLFIISTGLSFLDKEEIILSFCSGEAPL